MNHSLYMCFTRLWSSVSIAVHTADETTVCQETYLNFIGGKAHHNGHVAHTAHTPTVRRCVCACVFVAPANEFKVRVDMVAMLMHCNYVHNGHPHLCAVCELAKPRRWTTTQMSNRKVKIELQSYQSTALFCVSTRFHIQFVTGIVKCVHFCAIACCRVKVFLPSQPN